MVEVATYFSHNAKPQWIGFVVLPNGDHWMVRFVGDTEQEVKTKADEFWAKELEKRKAQLSAPVERKPVDQDPYHENKPLWPATATGRGAHFIGTTWVLNKVTREKKRLPAAEAETLLATGDWERGGPRSK